MTDRHERAIAIVGVGALLPEAPDAKSYWENLCAGRYSITEVPEERWSVADYYDPDPAAPDKTYSKIGGWVRGFEFDWKRFHIPPRVADAMDQGQQWAVKIAAEALDDYGFPDRPLDQERTAVIFGAAMGGERHYLTTMRINFPEFARALGEVEAFGELPEEVRRSILARWHEVVGERLPPITEDTMPGELSNIMSGRVANVLNLRGPNFITDAACASTFAAIDAAADLLVERHCDAAVAGGVDRNMGVSSFVKFCKIGALSPTGTRPFGDGADGFVMGEGSAAFLLKRLADAERDGDRVYAVLRGVGGSSDGKGKGITAPNPIGQRLAIERAWQDAGLDPATASMIEAHGTSTRVGDVVEVDSLAAVFGGAPRQSVSLGSAKSNVGHLKAGAGAAGLLKAVYAMHHRRLPPTLNAQRPNPGIDFQSSPFRLQNALEEWTPRNGAPRRAGVSAYGFGGTNFHLVLEEHRPGELTRQPAVAVPARVERAAAAGRPAPLQGIVALGASDVPSLVESLDALLQRVREGDSPPVAPPDPEALSAPERLVIGFDERAALVDKLQRAKKALATDKPSAWRALGSRGVFRGSGPAPGKLAFLFPGQGNQYLNMGRALADAAPEAAAVFAEADRIMEPILGQPLTRYLFVDPEDGDARERGEEALRQTAITQPAVLTVDVAMERVLAHHGFRPDVVMGHSLGEYAALVSAGVMPFAHALEASAARGREMTRVSLGDNGKMAAVMAPPEAVEEVLAAVDGYVVPANINSTRQCVIGGASEAVDRAVEGFRARGFDAVFLPVSHAFHTEIVAPAGEPLRAVLERLQISPPRVPVVGNVSGDFYPGTVAEIREVLVRQIASTVQWVKGLETLYSAGVRCFVEVGPKRTLSGFVADVLGDRDGVISLSSNHARTGEIASLNNALCGLYAAGYVPREERPIALSAPHRDAQETDAMSPRDVALGPGALESLTRMISEALRHRTAPGAPAGPAVLDRNDVPAGSVVVSGTGLGLPGAEKPVMDSDNAERILRGEQFVDLVPERYRNDVLAKRVTRVVKGADGSGRLETIDSPDEVIRLAGRPGSFDLAREYGVPPKLIEALDVTTQLAMAAGLDALRDAGIPLVQTWRRTTTGRHLPDRWLLPEALRDETGVIFASAFPGFDRFADETKRYYTWRSRRAQLEALEDLRRYTSDQATLREIQRRIAELEEQIEREPYAFDRRFILRVLTMGHSQLAEYIGARGPNAHVNVACAATAQGVALAEDWIRSGRCRRVLVVGADDVTGENLFEWIGAGFLATGAAATDDRVEEAALPFDRRRHGTLLGMGACGLLIESQDAVEERGMRGVVEVLSTETRNSAFHATRLDVDHIAGVMDSLITSAERRFGVNRHAMAPETVFMSHETFTPARGGSASAEVKALRETFGPAASEIVMANTKGFTGHPMGVGVEDVIAVKILEHGIVPPVPNFREVDPELGPLTLSRGGRYPVKYAIHLAAGFGSQIALTLTRRIPGALDRIDSDARYARWLADVTGYDRAATEVVQRVLRVPSDGPPPRPAAPSPWTWGHGPSRRAPSPGDGRGGDTRPAPPPVRHQTPPPPRPASPAAAPEAVAPSAPQPAAAATAPPASAPQTEAPATAAPAPSTPAPAPAVDPVATRVLAIVAAQTGYPPDMLDMDLDLEADLGVDTVKQAETFAAVREEYGIPREDDLKLRDFPTLSHVVGFVRDRRPDLGPPREPTPGPGGAPASGAPGGAAATTAAAAADTSPPAAPAGALDAVSQKVLEIVADQTGYPPDMLDMDLDLEADLGVDTVKQAETFAAVREAWNIPREENLQLRDFPTLNHVVGFVRERRPDLVGDAAAAGTRPASAAARPAPAGAGPALGPARLEDADRVPRRVPVPSLRPPLEMSRATGVVLEEGRRVLLAPDQGGVGGVLLERLEKHGVDVLVLEPGAAPEALLDQIGRWRADGPIDGVFWLPALDAEPPIPEMDLASFRSQARTRVKSLYAVMRALYEDLGAAGRFLVSATRLGGLFGLGDTPATAPLGGAVAGFTKALGRERPHALVKVVDFAGGAGAERVAEALLAEALHDPGAVEVGHHDSLRWTLGLERQPAADGRPGMALDRDSVYVVTGAAGGITSAIVADLAAASGGTFYLLDLVPAPDPQDPRLALLREDRERLKTHLIEEARGRGEKPLPPAIEKQVLAAERAQAALAAIEAVRGAGGRPEYRSLDLTDGEAVAAVVEEIRERHGRIDVLIHAGGIEISRALPDKEPKEFDLVFDIKSDGFFSLLWAAEGMPLGATVVFSSIAGRFGNAGQTDYSAANAFLCSLSSHLRASRPETRTIAIDWTAWGGIGMATRGSIPQVMAAAGIDMLPPEAGIPTVRRELTAGGRSGELVVAGRLGVMEAERDASGGLDTAGSAEQLAARPRPRLMVAAPKAARVHGGLHVETTLDPKSQPFLFDHAIEGTPVLPGVMATEAFAEAAALLAGDGYAVVAVEDVAFETPLKFHRDRPVTFHVTAEGRPGKPGEVVVAARLHTLIQPKPEVPAVEKVHFRARVRLGRKALTTPKAVAFKKPSAKRLDIGSEAIYSVYFHGPAYRVVEKARVEGETAVGLMARDLPPGTQPEDAELLMEPRLLELCFQTAGLWEIVNRRVLALPMAVSSVRVFRAPAEAGRRRLWAVVQARNGGEHFDVRVVDDAGEVYAELEGYRTVKFQEGAALPS